ncbi:hypothetical protein ABL78_6586 [Leptomonas seymouri]|uniref:Uncharacterized protein n=1 Tax=Leptomonas seymouri TaxID=5684 RepID=A0A0N0P432_LEPSE|nr:hypothetical protein ABL78_6586 [Leptomonas seymouri]|eukprot:KPI84357.1 hypothetical protein ABL78_6586 [Leptomonas seymouri]
MEGLAKSVQQAQAAVLGVQDDLALLRRQLEDDGAAAPADGNEPAANPYYVELHSSIHQKQEAAAQLLQSSAHLFYEQFGALEEKAARLENVHQKEKELQAAKKSMQRYFDAHARELEEVNDTHDGVLRLELEKQLHLQQGAVALRLSQRHQQLAHHVLLVWMKKAMIRNLTREYMARQSSTRHAYQEAACEALAQQRQAISQSRVFHTWRSRLHGRQLRQLEGVAVESEKRAQFFRQELATAQQALHERLGAALELRQDISIECPAKAKAGMTNAATVSNAAGEHEEEMQRMRMALEEMTLEFSERTGTYIRQQEHLERLFRSKEQKLCETVVGLQANLSAAQQAHQTHLAQQRHFFDQVNAYWQEQHREWQAAMQRKETLAHYSLLGLVGRLRHRHRALQAESAKLANEVGSLAPLSERCVWLENELATARQLLQKAKDKSRMSEQRASKAHLVSELLTDRLLRANNAALRANCFAQWMQGSRSSALQKSRSETYELRLALQKQRQQLLIQQQERTARHQSEVAALEGNLEQLRRTNVRLQSELDAAARAQQDRDRAVCDGAVKNGELSAALLREKMERRGLHEKWWCSRAENVVLSESQARCAVEAQEFQWWSALQQRERAVLKVWTASLQFDAAQLTAVCAGWEAHCDSLKTEHERCRRHSASQSAGALERTVLHLQTCVRWAAWRAWAQERRTVRTLEAQAAESRRELTERHRSELARLHARHDSALHAQQQELTLEKSQLQSIHQERSEVQRRVHAQEQSQLIERHQRQLGELQTAHREATWEHEDTVRRMQGQMEHLGAVVVEYCANATFSRWRSWAMLRRAQRDGWQRRGFLLRVQEWHATTARSTEGALLEKQRLFASFTAQAAEEFHATARSLTQRFSQERERYDASLRKVELAKDAAVQEAAHVRGELQHTRSLYKEEMAYCEEVQQSVLAERRDHRAALSLAARWSAWREACHRTWWEQQLAVGLVFEDAVTEMLRSACIDTQSLQETYVDCVKEREATRRSLHIAIAERAQLEEAHIKLAQCHEALEKSHAEASKEVSLLTDALSALKEKHASLQSELDSATAEKQVAEAAHAALTREHGAILGEFERISAEAGKVQSDFSDYVKMHEVQRADAALQASPPASPSVTSLANGASADDVLEVSALDAEEQKQKPEETHWALSAAPTDAVEDSCASAAAAVGSLLQAFPGDVACRLQELEAYTASSAGLLSEAAQDHLGRLLHKPFVLDTHASPAPSPWTAGAASISPGTVDPSDAVRMVCHMLETLRRAALRWSEAQAQRCSLPITALGSAYAPSPAAPLRSSSGSLVEAAQQQAKEKQLYEQLLGHLRVEAADTVEKHTRDIQLMRQNYTSEIEELKGHLKLLEDELEYTRQATQSAVSDAVARQAELLTIEHDQALRSAKKKLTRLATEKALLEERLAAKECDCESRLRQERDAVARLQERLGEVEAASAGSGEGEQHWMGSGAPESPAVHFRWETYVSCSADLFAMQCAKKAEWFVGCAMELLNQEREEWESEVLHLRERVASLLESVPSTPPLRCTERHTEAPAASLEYETSTQIDESQQHQGHQGKKPEQTVLGDTLVDASSQALTLSPSPQRSTATRVSKSAISAHLSVSPHHPTGRSTPARAASTGLTFQHSGASAVRDVLLCSSAGTSPTRCHSPSLDSLDLSQSLLRYSMMLSDQRTRNTERLERANALVSEVDDLLSRGVELTHLAGTQGCG